MSYSQNCDCGDCVECLRRDTRSQDELIIRLKHEIERLQNLIKYIPHRKK